MVGTSCDSWAPQSYHWTDWQCSDSSTATYTTVKYRYQIASNTSTDWTTTASLKITVSDTAFIQWPKSPKEAVREEIQRRLEMPFIHRRNPLGHSADSREIAARETLRRVIGDKAYQRLLVTGFLPVRAKSGRTYLLYPGKKMCECYEQHQLKERLCIYLQGDFPPTDELIVKYLLALNNEDMLRAKSNISKATAFDRNQFVVEAERPSLPQLFAAAKQCPAIVLAG